MMICFQEQKSQGNKTGKLRFVLWLSIAIYAFSLPYMIIIYDIISSRWSPAIAGLVPRSIIISAGASKFLRSGLVYEFMRNNG